MSELEYDKNYPVWLNAAGITPTTDPINLRGVVHAILQHLGGGGAGTVTSASVVSTNGLAGTVATPTTTPAITLTTSVTGIVKGNGTAFGPATAGTDYLLPSGSGAALSGITASQVGAAPSTWTGDVLISGAGTTLQTTANTESVVRTPNSPNQLALMTAALNFNSQKGTNQAAGTAPTDSAIVQQSLAWVVDPVTWTRTANTTFTVPGDLHTLYTKGTKVKWAESGTVKYGVIASSAFTSLTTVTLVPTSDYVMAATPDASTPSYSYGTPQGFPSSFTYAPTYTGFSAVPTTNLSWWAINNGLCTFSFAYLTPGTSNATSLTVSLPIAVGSVSNNDVLTVGNGVDSGTAVAASIQLLAGGTTLTAGKIAATATWTATGSKNVVGQVVYPI